MSTANFRPAEGTDGSSMPQTARILPVARMEDTGQRSFENGKENARRIEVMLKLEEAVTDDAKTN